MSTQQVSYTFEQLFSLIKTLPKFPVLEGKPQPFIWYRLPLSGCIDGEGKATFSDIRIGTENKLIVNFMGGGFSWNDFTAARPMAAENPYPEGFYFNSAEDTSDFVMYSGIGEYKEDNPFAAWSVININYTTGDFHIGTGELSYTALDGSERTLYHHGYDNFKATMEAAVQYVGKPDKMLICGMSAGAFGVSALAGEVIDYFGGCEDITVCMDSAMLFENWHEIAEKVWKAPEHIASRLHGNNFTLDCLDALHARFGNKIKYLYTNSVRDGELSRFQSFMDGKEMLYASEAGEKYRKDLAEMYKAIEAIVPECGFCFYEHLPFENIDPSIAVTNHAILWYPGFWKKDENGNSVAEWLLDALNGNVKKIGTELLN